MDITFNCNKCGQHIVIDEAGAGQLVGCPKCKTQLEVPYKSVAPAPVPRAPSALLPAQRSQNKLPYAVRLLIVFLAVACMTLATALIFLVKTRTAKTGSIPNSPIVGTVEKPVVPVATSEPKPPIALKAPTAQPAKESLPANPNIPGSLAYLDARYGFRDVKFGEGVAQLGSATKKVWSEGELRTYERNQEDLAMGEAKFRRITYDFYQDKLMEIKISFVDFNDADSFIRILKAAYGEPSSSNEHDKVEPNSPHSIINIWWEGKLVEVHSEWVFKFDNKEYNNFHVSFTEKAIHDRCYSELIKITELKAKEAAKGL